MLLQGVVDAWFETLEGITVVDFKSDRVSRSGAAARGEEYRPQLEAYSRALEEITGKQVVRKALWFFEPGELIASVKGRQKGREKSQDNFLKK